MTVYDDMEQDFIDIYRKCQDFTMTSIERMYSLFQAVKYVIDADISGDFVECGVWRGGSVMLIAETLLYKGVSDRQIYLYDTFDGMSAPTTVDIDLYGGQAKEMLEAESRREDALVWCVAPLDDVRENLEKTSYPMENFKLIKGKVEDTIPSHAPQTISLLRLDTDWYESTKVEMDHLYPRLVQDGVLIVDDYGHWRGSRLAIDEYLNELPPRKKIILHRVDYTGRIGVKRQ